MNYDEYATQDTGILADSALTEVLPGDLFSSFDQALGHFTWIVGVEENSGTGHT